MNHGMEWTILLMIKEETHSLSLSRDSHGKRVEIFETTIVTGAIGLVVTYTFGKLLYST
jgi:hypothetical protein